MEIFKKIPAAFTILLLLEVLIILYGTILALFSKDGWGWCAFGAFILGDFLLKEYNDIKKEE